MQNKIYYIVICCLVVIGCDSKTSKPLQLFKDVQPEQFESSVQSMNVSKDSVMIIPVQECRIRNNFPVSSVVDSLHYIQLDNAANALLGAINKIVLRDSTLFVLDRYKTKSIKKFTNTGTYLTDIGKMGDAPAEYAEPTDFIVCDSTVIVYDQFSSKFNYYTLNGEFIATERLPFLCMRFDKLSKDNYVFYSLDSDNQHMHSIEDYSIFTTNTDFVINNRGFFRKRGLYSSVLSNTNFVRMNDKLYYHPPFSGKIHEILSEDTAALRIQLDFGKRQVPDEILLSENRGRFLKENDANKYDFFSGEYWFCGTYLYFSYVRKHEVFRCFYSLTTGFFEGSSIMYNDICPIFPFSNVIGVDGCSIITYAIPGLIADARERYTPEAWKEMVGEFAEIAETLHEDNNLLLVWFHLKQ